MTAYLYSRITMQLYQAGALSSCASFVLGVGEEAANEYLHVLFPSILSTLSGVPPKS